MTAPVDQPNEETCDPATGRRFVPCASIRGVPLPTEPCPGERHEYDMVYGTGICPGYPLTPAGDPSEQEALAELLAAHATWGWVPAEDSPDHLYVCTCGDGIALLTTPDAAHRLHVAQILAARDADLTRRAARGALLGAAEALVFDGLRDCATTTAGIRAYADEKYPEAPS